MEGHGLDQFEIAEGGEVRVQCELVEAVTLHHEDPYAANTKDAPDTVAPQANDTVRLEGGRLVGTLPAISWSLVRLTRPTA